MSARSDRETGEVYHDDDPYDERPAEAREGEGTIPYFPAVPGGWWPFERGRADEAEHRDYEGHEERTYDGETSAGLSSLWDESLITLLIVGGAILFLLPEPVTSGLGVLLMGLGVLAWAIDWAT